MTFSMYSRVWVGNVNEYFVEKTWKRHHRQFIAYLVKEGKLYIL